MSVSSHGLKSSFPSPTGRYKVHVNDGDWKSYKAARLQISMNNPKHTGEKFLAEAEWVAARFEQVQLIVSDTLHRYNIMGSHGVDEITAHNMALRTGDEWITANSTAIDLLPNRKITRWDDWLKHPSFAASHAQILDCHARDKNFAIEVEKVVYAFMAKKPDTSAEKREGHILLSRSYLLEEIAAFAVMHGTERMIDVRPGSPIKPVLDLLSSGVVEGVPSGCKNLDSVIIDFTRNRGFVPPASSF